MALDNGEAPALTEEQECLIDLPVDANIPEAYIPATNQRIAMYKRIADFAGDADANDVSDELTDRYGQPPQSENG